MARLRNSFRRDQSAVALTEFALVMPFLVFAVFAEWELYSFTMATQRLQIAAESVAQMFSAATISPTAVTDGDGVVTDSEIATFVSNAYFIYPDQLAAAAPDVPLNWTNLQPVSGDADTALASLVDVQVTAIKMVLQPDGTTYKPKTAWRASFNNSSPNARACDTEYVPADDTATPTPTTLPAGLIGPNSLIVVDIRMTYRPTFGVGLLPPIPVVRSVFLAPRNVPFIEYSGNGSMAVVCNN